MGCGTGFVVGYCIGGPLGSIAGIIIGIIGGQYSVLNHFAGAKRGEFEYLYQKSFRKRNIKKKLIKLMGATSYYRTQLNEFGEISWSKGEKYQKLLNKKHSYTTKELFYICLKLGLLSQRKRDYEKAISHLKMAIDYNPSDLVANFVLGECSERLGFGEKAISAYETALNDLSCQSDSLRQFINGQILRVHTKGPSKKPPNPGLMHSGLGR